MFRALKIGGLALSGLGGDPRPAQVESTFRTAINVIHGEASLVSLHPAGCPVHPCSIVIGGETPWSEADSPLRRVRAGDRALISLGGIDFAGGAAVSFGGAEVCDTWLGNLGAGCAERASRRAAATWDSLVDEALTGRAAGGITSPFLAAVSLRGRPGRSGADCRGGGRDVATGVADGIGGLMRAEAECLIAEMIADMATARRSGSAGALLPLLGKIAGLGPGLTPSGDDFLVGLLAADRAFGADRGGTGELDIAGLIEACTRGASRQSQHMFRASLAGHFPEAVIALVSELARENAHESAHENAHEHAHEAISAPALAPTCNHARGQAFGPASEPASGVAPELEGGEVLEVVRRLVAVGSTSGQDMLAGILFWLGGLRDAAPSPARCGVA
jgi:hypothetical protein